MEIARMAKKSGTAITSLVTFFLFIILLNIFTTFIQCQRYDGDPHESSDDWFDGRTRGHHLRRHKYRQTLKNPKGNPICYDEYGCFDQSEVPPEFKILQVADLKSLYPERPEKVNTHFGVFSCRDRYNPTILAYNFTKKQLRTANFDPEMRTIVLIHGYTDHYDQFNWMGDLKDTILTMEPCQLNVIVVDWRGGSKTSPNYLQAVANVRLVGAMIATMVERFTDYYDLNNDAFSVLGHSLGGHVAGFVGKRLVRPKLRLIISLDPAGPAYNNVSSDARISYEDARTVVVMHTNGGGFGLSEAVGHYDFYVNGGESQTGCVTANDIIKILVNSLTDGLRDVFFCSHRRAQSLVIYDEFRYDNYQSMAYICSDGGNFSAGKCAMCADGADECQPFGSWFDYWQQPERRPPMDWNKPIRYYIDTWDQAPYSYFFYQIKVVTGGNFAPYAGSLELNMTGSLRRDFIERITIEDVTFEPNQQYYYLHRSRKSLGRIVTINAMLVAGKPRPSRDVSSSPPPDDLIKPKTSTFLSKVFGSKRKENKKSGVEKTGGGESDDGYGQPSIQVRDIFVHYMNGYEQQTRMLMSSRLRAIRPTVRIDGQTGFYDVTNGDGIAAKPTPLPDFGQKD